MGAPAGQIPNQPGVNRTAGELPALSAVARPGDILQQPGDFGAGEVGVRNEARFLTEGSVESFRLDAVAHRGGAAALPDDSMMDGLAGRSIPYHHGLTLVGDANGGDILGAR